MRLSFQLLNDCDTIYMLKGWETSPGANQEFGYAISKSYGNQNLKNKRRKFMLDLSNIFNKDMKKAIMSKEKLAEMLRVTPEALKAFEKSYQLHSMNEPISDNLFKVNAKQAASLNPKQDVPEKGKVQDLIDRIVNELLDQALIYEYDGKPGFTYGNIYSCNQTRTVKVPENSEVTLEEINELPKELRPDLTGRYVKKSLSDGNGRCIVRAISAVSE